MSKVVVIGGNAAGMSAASQVKRQKPDWPVTVFEKGSNISYAACGIPYHVEGLVASLDELLTLTPGDAINKRKIDLRLNHSVRKIDPGAKTVLVEGPEGSFVEPFDLLVIATGARPVRDRVKYRPSGRVYNVHTLEDSAALRRFVEKEKPGNCAVVGGGYIAVEMLEALRVRGLETHLIHRRRELSRSFENEISALTLAEMERQGINLKLGNEVSNIYEEDGSAFVKTGDEVAGYDLVVVGIGVEPQSDLAIDCAVETGAGGAIRVNQYMQTNYPHIYAAGDCTETRHIVSGKPLFSPLALKANKEGMIAGINICGGREVFPGVLGTAVVKFFELGLARTGLTHEEAGKNGFDVIKFKVEASSKANYYPGAAPLTAILTADKKSGRLLGAQLAGPVDGVKRIDVYAAAITAEMSLDQVFHLDLAYAPPFSPVYDPVVLTGRVGRKLVTG